MGVFGLWQVLWSEMMIESGYTWMLCTASHTLLLRVQAPQCCLLSPMRLIDVIHDLCWAAVAILRTLFLRTIVNLTSRASSRRPSPCQLVARPQSFITGINKNIAHNPEAMERTQDACRNRQIYLKVDQHSVEAMVAPCTLKNICT